jgi:hypothetical protein
MPVQVIKAPEPLPLQYQKGVIKKSVFLAGSIEQGKAEDWQTHITKELNDYADYIFNPRRDGWDSTWEQSIHNKQFNTQVNWELTALDSAEHIFMYFSPETKSPISLLELGLYAPTGKMIVCCPDGFWRKGNVEVVCYRYNVTLVHNLNEALSIQKWNLRN